MNRLKHITIKSHMIASHDDDSLMTYDHTLHNLLHPAQESLLQLLVHLQGFSVSFQRAEQANPPLVQLLFEGNSGLLGGGFT
jgi:hypothetical protein